MPRAWTRRGFLASCIGAAALSACATGGRPRVGLAYRESRRSATTPPLVLIPGAFGSTLEDVRTGREIWPASDAQLLLGNYTALELAIDERTLEPLAAGFETGRVFREGLGRDFYGHVLDMLQREGGYLRCQAGEAPRCEPARALYVHLYDFRLDVPYAARRLAELIGRIREDFADPALRVDVVAHSNGGLLARYYALYGDADLPPDGQPFQPTRPGADTIRRLLQVGTPNLGTLQPVLSYLRGEEIGLRHIPAEVIATCTGAPQLMPHPAVPWLVAMDGHVIDVDLFDIGTWRDFGWSLYDPAIAARTIARHGGGAEGKRYLDVLKAYMAKHLRRGRRFAESLAVPRDPRDVRPYVFGGDCELTLARLVCESSGGRLRARERIEDIAAPMPGIDYESAMFEPGDTVVTRSSLLGRRSLDVAAPRSAIEPLRIANSVFLCERHQQLTGNPSFQDNLLHALLSVDPA
jgi:pimeloyl-ACP methyl ester carboxylesterase